MYNVSQAAQPTGIEYTVYSFLPSPILHKIVLIFMGILHKVGGVLRS